MSDTRFTEISTDLARSLRQVRTLADLQSFRAQLDGVIEIESSGQGARSHNELSRRLDVAMTRYMQIPADRRERTDRLMDAVIRIRENDSPEAFVEALEIIAGSVIPQE